MKKENSVKKQKCSENDTNNKDIVVNSDMGKIKKILTNNTTLLISIVTFISYLITYITEAVYLSYYGININLVEIRIEKILLNFVLLLSLSALALHIYWNFFLRKEILILLKAYSFYFLYFY